MAVTYPRQLPSGIKFRPSRFNLLRPIVASPSGKAKMNYTMVDDDAWQIEFQTFGLKESDLGVIEAWVLSLKGGLKTALIQQTALCYPIAHTGSASRAPANDTGVVGSIAGNVVTINDVATGLVLTPGDIIGFSQSGKYGLGRVTDATGTGTSRTVTLEPAPRPYITVGAMVTFAQPKLLMRLVPSSYSVSGFVRPTVSFSLIESAQ